MGGSSKHVLPVYLDGDEQEITASGNQEWNGLTSKVKVNNSAATTVRLPKATHYGTIVVINKTGQGNASIHPFIDGVEGSLIKRIQAAESVTLIWNGSSWNTIGETEVSLATTGVNLTLSGFLAVDGNINIDDSATDINLLDNNASAVVFKSSTSGDVLKIDTTDNSEKAVALNLDVTGDLDVDGATTLDTVTVSEVLKTKLFEVEPSAQLTAAASGVAIPEHTLLVSVNGSSTASDEIALPAPTLGDTITIINGAKPFELVTSDDANIGINNASPAAGDSLTIAANQVTVLNCFDVTNWTAEKVNLSNGVRAGAGSSGA